jgi:hypothetical protein
MPTDALARAKALVEKQRGATAAAAPSTAVKVAADADVAVANDPKFTVFVVLPGQDRDAELALVREWLDDQHAIGLLTHGRLAEAVQERNRDAALRQSFCDAREQWKDLLQRTSKAAGGNSGRPEETPSGLELLGEGFGTPFRSPAEEGRSAEVFPPFEVRDRAGVVKFHPLGRLVRLVVDSPSISSGGKQK